MVIHAYLEESKAMQLMAKPLNLAYSKPAQGEGNFGYFKQYIQKEFAALSDSLRKQDGSLYDLNRDGLVIQTSLDYELHMMALEI
jgi:penicillin-binding protein 1A